MTRLWLLGATAREDAAALPSDMRAEPAGALVAVLTDGPDDAPRAALAAAARRAAAATPAFVPVAPARATTQEARDWLAREDGVLAAALARLHGCAEWVASAAAEPHAPPEPAPRRNGREWLQARAAERRMRAAMAEAAMARLRALAADLESLARDYAVRSFDGPRGVGADLALLAPRGAGPAIALRAAAHGLTVAGPWPAYSFAAERPAA
jgi:hypothetical protein